MKPLLLREEPEASRAMGSERVREKESPDASMIGSVASWEKVGEVSAGLGSKPCASNEVMKDSRLLPAASWRVPLLLS